jgi:dihydrofolate reductase
MTTKTQFYGASSLDGFLATTDDNLDWLLQFADGAPTYAPFIAQVGAIAMGAATYEWMLRNHVQPTAGQPQPWPYTQPVWVFTHRQLPRVPGADVRFVSGDVRPVHAAMVAAAAGKNVWLDGGGELVGQFWDRGLLDELIVQISPVTLGAGKPLLPRTIHTPPLKLVSVQQFGDTFAELRYDVPRQSAGVRS